MQRAHTRLLAIIAANVMLLMLVCPSLPTPTFVHKQKSLDQHAILPLPALAVTLAVVLIERLVPVAGEVFWHRSAELVDLVCQRLC